MKLNWLSHSNLSSFDWCQFRYWLTYELKLPEIKQPSKATEFGSAVHEVLADYAAGQTNWEENLEKYLNKRKPWDYANCNSVEELESLREEIRANGKKLVLKALNREDKPFDREVLVYEGKFDTKLSENLPILGYIDLVTVIDKDTIEIRDWKTGRPEKLADVRKGNQPRIYDLAATLMWPQYPKRIINIDFLKSQPVVMSYTDEERMATIKELEMKSKKIKETKVPTRVLDVNRSIKWKCSWCIGADLCDELYEKHFPV